PGQLLQLRAADVCVDGLDLRGLALRRLRDRYRALCPASDTWSTATFGSAGVLAPRRERQLAQPLERCILLMVDIRAVGRLRATPNWYGRAWRPEAGNPTRACASPKKGISR